MADSEEKLGRFVSEFGRVCKRRRLRMNVGKSKVMRCSRYGNGDRMHVILNGEQSEEVDCFKYLGSLVATDGGCGRDVVHRMNEGYRAWGLLNSVVGVRPLPLSVCMFVCVCSYIAMLCPEKTYLSSSVISV